MSLCLVQSCRLGFCESARNHSLAIVLQLDGLVLLPNLMSVNSDMFFCLFCIGRLSFWIGIGVLQFWGGSQSFWVCRFFRRYKTIIAEKGSIVRRFLFGQFGESIDQLGIRLCGWLQVDW